MTMSNKVLKIVLEVVKYAVTAVLAYLEGSEQVITSLF